MVRQRNKSKAKPTRLIRSPEMIVDGFVVEQGDIIKVQDEWGMRFKFDNFVTDPETGAEWVDCYEVYKMRTGCLRSFKIERIKRIPKRRKRGRRAKASPTS